MIGRIPSPADETSIPGQEKDALAVRAIAGVLRRAQDGELPLFAWTLGLPQSELLAMIQQCFPELGYLESMPNQDYDALRQSVPSDFIVLSELLFRHRTLGHSAQLCDWLSRAVAAAGYGCHHLWEDLGLHGREAVSELMRRYFTSLYQRNVHDLKWKRFLFMELGTHIGNLDKKPPECTNCDQFRICFAATERTEKVHGYGK